MLPLAIYGFGCFIIGAFMSYVLFGERKYKS